MYSGSRAHLYCPVEAYAYMFPYRIFGVFLYSRVARLMLIGLLGSTNICFYIEHFKYFSILGLQCSFLLPFWGHANICVRIEYLVYFGALGLQRSFSLPCL